MTTEILASHQFENGSVIEITASGGSIDILDALDAAVTLIEMLIDRLRAEHMSRMNS
jgi:hypothetical protein